MFTTLPGIGGTLFAAALLLPFRLAGETVLVPIASRVFGQQNAAWTTEVRITNRTGTPLQFTIADWIGTPGFIPATYTVPPHSTTSLGGSDVFRGPVESAYGLAICTADPGLFVQGAVLSGIGGRGWSGDDACMSYDGGGMTCPGDAGAGPLIEGLRFADPGEETWVPWLHTAWTRRTNLVLVNPDDQAALVTVTITSQDGGTTVSDSLLLPARSYNQLNDLFSQQPWRAISEANGLMIPCCGAGASAVITSDHRLLAMSYVISNNNNSLTISLPR